MKFIYFWAVLSLVALLSAPNKASAQERPSFGSGVMASECARLVEGMDDNVVVGRNPLAFAMLSWTEGYITATNLSLGKEGAKFDLNSLSAVEIWAAIYGFCKRNPDKVAVEAAMYAMTKLNRVEPEASK